MKNFKRIVIKIGSSIFGGSESLELDALYEVCAQVQSLIDGKKEVVLVSSGAIACGVRALGLKERPRQMSALQASSAIGQNELMSAYRGFFNGKTRTAQVLLTWEDFNDRKRYLRARETLLALLKYKSLPIVNENDTVSTNEIKFGDNDRLSALVAKLISADLLIILSDVDGLLDKKRKLISLVTQITSQIKELACPTSKKTCVGGMITKLEAAKIAIDSGIPCVIANGRKPGIINSVLIDPEGSGTLFLSQNKLSSRKHWIAHGTNPLGKIVVDDGAKEALLRKKSLLSVGVIATKGSFERGDVVSIIDSENNEFARGRADFSEKEVDKIKGRRFPKEIIHCDNLVLLI
ncbi:MAG: glutamate 5-kinase [Candidatus Omnitrophota bacterium]|jgi:glutamate 5-kinase|nr:MAG: glutamate 5-kinase [Candidatus Omnitrophota bacterium]